MNARIALALLACLLLVGCDSKKEADRVATLQKIFDRLETLSRRVDATESENRALRAALEAKTNATAPVQPQAQPQAQPPARTAPAHAAPRQAEPASRTAPGQAAAPAAPAQSPAAGPGGTYIALIPGGGGPCPSLRFVAHYGGGQWLRLDRFQINVDGRLMDWKPKNVSRGSGGETFWESSDDPADARLLDILRAVATSRRTVFRFVGQRQYADHLVSGAEKRDIAQALIASGAAGSNP